MEYFFEIHKDIPRQGPGDNNTTKEVFKKLNIENKDLTLLDIGCGPGMQTITLAKELDGRIEAIDLHEAFLDELLLRAKEEGVSEKVEVKKMSMFDITKKNYDILWSEGAIFIIGFERGLREWRGLINTNGYLVVSELSWFEDERPKEVEEYWNKNYPGMRSIEENISIARKCGYEVEGTINLDESAWFDNYYNPIEERIAMLREKYRGNEEANRAMDNTLEEIETYRKYSKYYGYTFYILRKVEK